MSNENAMYEISVKSSFCGAHHLRGYRGPCARPHGHNWEIVVCLRGSRTGKLGMLIDFKKVKAAVQNVLAGLDHRDLNRLPAFKGRQPTSEHLAQYLFARLSARLNSPACKVQRIKIRETPGMAAEYWEEA